MIIGTCTARMSGWAQFDHSRWQVMGAVIGIWLSALSLMLSLLFDHGDDIQARFSSAGNWMAERIVVMKGLTLGPQTNEISPSL